jgi:hypothetical protein
MDEMQELRGCNQMETAQKILCEMSENAGMITQEKWILSALHWGPITPMQALKGCGCLRLAARIKDLRAQGHNIITEPVNENGKRFAKYHLIQGAKDGR